LSRKSKRISKQTDGGLYITDRVSLFHTPFFLAFTMDYDIMKCKGVAVSGGLSFLKDRFNKPK
jgi:hypothetical protein